MIDYSFTYSDLEFFLLILIRMSGFFVSAPFFGIQGIPRRFKAALTVALSMLIFSVLPDHTVPEYGSVIGFEIIVLKELIAGLFIGLGANLAFETLNLAGKIADIEIGLSMVQLFDPMTRQPTGFTGSLYQYGVLLIMFVTNLHHYVLRAFFETYTLIPIGGVKLNSDKVVTVVTLFLTDYVEIAFMVCLPVMASMMLLNAVLGILAKVAPQMNMFAVGVQLKMFVGFGVLIVTIALLPALSDAIFNEMKIMMTAMVESMQ